MSSAISKSPGTSAVEVLSPPPVRYIKLGPGGRWAKRSLSAGEIHFGHSSVPHKLAASGNREALVTVLVERGRTAGKASDFAREITDFYQLGPETIWITIEAGQLWWARAETEVIPIEETENNGGRYRRTIGGWRNTDALGRPLLLETLSTKLTKVGAYRQTLCAVEASDYLLRKLAGEAEPVIEAALKARTALVASAENLIAGLHWADFETMVDLIFARGGWHRVSALGGTMKDADLVVEQAVTGETALVQVKSVASQRVLDDYVARFDANPAWSRMFFVCHSPRGDLSPKDRTEVAVWARKTLAETAIRNGLFDWLVERAG
ncbi:restriction endonuclease [uncultured Enterovirga sp.]|uniref:restriction endonuclease n=1 Tax=uncultured Enterovirga sp. TaxID=2026352 RepID=UPI0035CB06D9